MIEISQQETRPEAEETSFSLPRNIRQIGEAGKERKVYIEDYVMTYIKQLSMYGRSKEDALILLGACEQIEETSCFFVSGALKVAEIASPLYSVHFAKETWNRACEEAMTFFPMLHILGWALISDDADFSSGYRVKATQEAYFHDSEPVFIEYIKAEKEEQVFLYQYGRMNKQGGHYIYYDKNDAMQNYMVSKKDVFAWEEDEQMDQATRQFRMMVQEKKEKKRRQRMNLFLYTVAAMLALVVVLTGFTMLGNYEKMQNMEQVLFGIAQQTEERQQDPGVVDLDEKLGQLGGKAADMDALQETDIPATDPDIDTWQPTGRAQADIDPAKDGGDVEGVAKQQNDAVTVAAQQSDAETVAVLQNDAGQEETTQASHKNPGTDAETVSMQKSVDGQDEEAQDISAKPEQPPAKPEYQSYLIVKGDTLKKINDTFYGKTDRIGEICELNHIENPDNIHYGEKIILPY
ncbi:MAG: LysM peptidoglycan-binding domain-containing protein [Lachnospiraceae bacterium]|nr:LysM peptidoglycan-binding domain-containing protein [Lachnospiraceae bacterium]